jgi:hypothetical protein
MLSFVLRGVNQKTPRKTHAVTQGSPISGSRTNAVLPVSTDPGFRHDVAEGSHVGGVA